MVFIAHAHHILKYNKPLIRNIIVLNFGCIYICDEGDEKKQEYSDFIDKYKQDKKAIDSINYSCHTYIDRNKLTEKLSEQINGKIITNKDIYIKML